MKNTSDFLRVIFLSFLGISFGACASLHYQKGFKLTPGSSVKDDPLRQSIYGNVYMHDPYLEISIRPAPSDSLLSLGPILPIIPWFPGIVHSVKFRNEDEIKNEKIEIRIAFLGNYKLSQAGNYVFTPQHVQLNAGAADIYPSDIRYRVAPGNNKCIENPDGKYSLSVSTAVLSEVEFTLIFNVLAPEIKTATLRIGNVVSDGNPINIPEVDIRRLRRFSIDTVP